MAITNFRRHLKFVLRRPHRLSVAPNHCVRFVSRVTRRNQFPYLLPRGVTMTRSVSLIRYLVFILVAESKMPPFRIFPMFAANGGCIVVSGSKGCQHGVVT